MLALGGLTVWALVRPDTRRTTSGSVELQPGVRYRFYYETPRLVDVDEANELLEKHSVADVAVGQGPRGFRVITFTALPTTAVKAVIGTPLSNDNEDVRLTEVRRLD